MVGDKAFQWPLQPSTVVGLGILAGTFCYLITGEPIWAGVAAAAVKILVPDNSTGGDQVFEAIAKLLLPEQREYFYQRMVYFRHSVPSYTLLRTRTAPQTEQKKSDRHRTWFGHRIRGLDETHLQGAAAHHVGVSDSRFTGFDGRPLPIKFVQFS